MDNLVSNQKNLKCTLDISESQKYFYFYLKTKKDTVRICVEIFVGEKIFSQRNEQFTLSNFISMANLNDRFILSCKLTSYLRYVLRYYLKC